ncbi:MAG TPA: hypothetical protein VGF99_18105 [Myxococcota bacterium]
MHDEQGLDGLVDGSTFGMQRAGISFELVHAPLTSAPSSRFTASMQHDTRAAFIERHIFGDVDAVIAWAVERLDAASEVDRDNDDLAVLAGLSAHEIAEVDACFARALVALDEQPDDLAVEVRRYAARIASTIVSSDSEADIRAVVGVLLSLHRQSPQSDLSAWDGLDDALTLVDNGTYGNIADVMADARDEARALVAAVGDG